MMSSGSSAAQPPGRRPSGAPLLLILLSILLCAGTPARAARPQEPLDVASAYRFAIESADCVGCPGVESCAPVDPTRVDCLLVNFARDGCDVAVLTLTPNGYLYYGRYPCRPELPIDLTAQIQPVLPGTRLWPVTPAYFGGAWPLKPGESTRYGRTIWLGRNRYPVRYYVGRTSLHRLKSIRTFERIGGAATVLRLWTTRSGLFIPGSYVPVSMWCGKGTNRAYASWFDFTDGVRARADGFFTVRKDPGNFDGMLRGHMTRDLARGRFRGRTTIDGRPCRIPGPRWATFKAERARAYPRRR